MSKYDALWEYVRRNGSRSLKLTFEEIRNISGIPLDHSFLKYKKELTEYGYEVGKISMKEQTVIFNKLVWQIPVCRTVENPFRNRTAHFHTLYKRFRQTVRRWQVWRLDRNKSSVCSKPYGGFTVLRIPAYWHGLFTAVIAVTAVLQSRRWASESL